MLPQCERTKAVFDAETLGDFGRYDIVNISLGNNGKFQLDCYEDYNFSGSRYAPSRTVSRFLKRLPELKQIHNRDMYTGVGYEVPATDTVVELINALVPAQHLRFTEDAKMLFNAILMGAMLSDQTAKVMADFKINRVVPAHSYELNAERPLADYQQVALCCTQISNGFGLFAEQGTGKTPIGIADICNSAKRHREEYEAKLIQWNADYTKVYEAYMNGTLDDDAISPEEWLADNPRPRYSMYTVCIVCPNSVRTNWLSEIQEFTTQPGRVTILRGNAIDRIKQLSDAMERDPDDELRFTVVICGYATIWRSWEAFKYIPWDLSILDEAHAIKDPKSKQSKQALALRDNSKRRLVLTGTPIGNSIMDMYMLLEFMERGGSGFSDFSAYKKFYGVFDNVGDRSILIGAQNVTFLQERLARKSFYITKKEALPNLPEKLFDIVEIEMTEQQTEFYNKLAKELAIEIERELARDDIERSMIIQNILVQLLRLSQITSGFITWPKIVDEETGTIIQEKRTEFFEQNPKADAVMADIKALGENEKAIIWCCHKADIETLSWYCDNEKIPYVTFHGDMTEDEREAAKYAYNHDRSIKVLFGTAASGGAGLNLVGYPPGHPEGYDTNTVLIGYMSKNWSQIQFSQSSDRGHRRGTRVNVTIRRYLVPNSIDTIIDQRVLDKQQAGIEIGDLRAIQTELVMGV